MDTQLDPTTTSNAPATDRSHEIIRYNNRKLYSKKLARYVSLEDIRELVREGQIVRVKGYPAGGDHTDYTLAQALVVSIIGGTSGPQVRDCVIEALRS